MRGKVSGELNNQAMDDLEILAFVSVTTGFIEIHLRSLQKNVEKMMIVMQPIGDTMGWVFAARQDKEANNGFILTGMQCYFIGIHNYSSYWNTL